MLDSSLISWVDVIGYLGGAVTFWAMYCRTIIPLRIGIICGNVGFLAFGFLAESYPTLVLHAFLLPLNSWRTLQMVKLIKEIKEQRADSEILGPLIPFMQLKKEPASSVLFRKDELSDRMILIYSGTVLLKEIDVRLGRDEILGEIGIFTPENRRTCTAVCETDCEIYTLSHEVMLQLYYQNPRFGLYLMRLVVGRLLNNWEKADQKAHAMLT